MVCDDAEKNCLTVWPGSFEDPARFEVSEAEKLANFVR